MDEITTDNLSSFNNEFILAVLISQGLNNKNVIKTLHRIKFKYIQTIHQLQAEIHTHTNHSNIAHHPV